jgi:hypothetical protein
MVDEFVGSQGGIQTLSSPREDRAAHFVHDNKDACTRVARKA